MARKRDDAEAEQAEPEAKGAPPDPWRAVPAEHLERLEAQAPGALPALAEWMEDNGHPWAPGARWLADSGRAPRVDRGAREGEAPTFSWGDRDGAPGLRASVLRRLDARRHAGKEQKTAWHLLDVCRCATEALEKGEAL